MAKLNAYEKHNNLNIHERRLQLTYLLNDETVAPNDRLGYDEIGKLVDYAGSTVRSYGYKFIEYLEEARRLFCSVVKKIINGIVEKVPVLFAKGTKLCYLFKFYDSNGDLVFSKVGTTERAIKTRLNEEIRKYSKKFDIYGVEIESVIDCGDIPPEGAECHIKGYFIKKYPNAYAKNDRFLGINISVDEFNEQVNAYLATA